MTRYLFNKEFKMFYILKDIQRIRNLTTGRLHTEMDHIYEDIEYIVGEKGIMTHMLPNASRALLPYLEKVITDKRFFDGQYDTTHTGEFTIHPMGIEEQEEFWKRYEALPHPFAALGTKS